MVFTEEKIQSAISNMLDYGNAKILFLSERKCSILVEKGDWRHAHAALDFVMRDLFGAENLHCEYSSNKGKTLKGARFDAIHTYRLTEKNQEEQ